jgi:hypothetical protein
MNDDGAADLEVEAALRALHAAMLHLDGLAASHRATTATGAVPVQRVRTLVRQAVGLLAPRPERVPAPSPAPV